MAARPTQATPEETAQPAEPLAFYSVANDRHFLGVVGLFNSLRLVGHAEPFFLLDRGLDDWQRELLAPHVTLVSSDADAPPTATKGAAPLAHPARVMALFDADVIVTRPLTDLVARAATGRVVAFPDDTPGRFFREWAALGLGEPRRQTYVSAGHFLVPHAHGRRLLERVAELSASVDVRRTSVAGGDPGYALYHLDQDVMNAVLATEVTPEELEIAGPGLVAYTPFRRLEVTDADRLDCRDADGSSPAILHHVLDKPWLTALPPNAYSVLLSRLLVASDVAIDVPRHAVPLRLRAGRLARADRRRAHAQASIRHAVRGRLGIRPRVRTLVHARLGGGRRT